jgi:hypothetical protein
VQAAQSADAAIAAQPPAAPSPPASLAALAVSGFFDATVQAPADDEGERFHFGGLEVDLEAHYGEHLSAAAALFWDGGSSTEVAAAIVDYHWFDDRVPPRGRIFMEPGLHLQAGRFDLPFGLDYQFFATPERPSVTAPLTTERIQRGGYNADGARVYGTWWALDYAAYWTDAFYGDDGSLVGGRLGLSAGWNPFRFHYRSTDRPALDVGLSYLQEMDGSWRVRERVFGADAMLRHGMFQLLTEGIVHDGRAAVATAAGIESGAQDESGFYATLIADLADRLARPLYLFARFDVWNPGRGVRLEDTGTRAPRTRRWGLGAGYNFNLLVRVKLELYNHLGHEARASGLSDHGAMAQVTVAF